MKIDIKTLQKTKGIGSKTLERIIEQHNIDNNMKSFKSEYISSDKYSIDKDMNLWQGDCLDLMSHIPDNSIDMILTDLPYGTTACSWDEVIPFEPLWSHYNRVIKDNGAIVLFGKEPFTSKLIMSNTKMFKYRWVWEKDTKSNFFQANHQPLNNIEDIAVFSKSYARSIKNKISMNYFPQFTIGEAYKKPKPSKTTGIFSTNHKNGKFQHSSKDSTKRHPYMRLNFNTDKETDHPTQKPVALLEYLIKTYTNEDMLVLDNTMGSGSTGVACKNLNRRFVGIELDEEYFEIAQNRIKGD